MAAGASLVRGVVFVRAVAASVAWALRKAARVVPNARVLAMALAVAAAAALDSATPHGAPKVRLADALAPEWEGRDIALVGVIDGIPKESARGTRFTFAVERAETANAHVPSLVSLSWFTQERKDGTADDVPTLVAGERWRLTVRVKRPHGTVNPHGFDVEAWLLENGIRATGYVRNDPANARIAAFAGRPGDYVERARTRCVTASWPRSPTRDTRASSSRWRSARSARFPKPNGACSIGRESRT